MFLNMFYYGQHFEGRVVKLREAPELDISKFRRSRPRSDALQNYFQFGQRPDVKIYFQERENFKYLQFWP